MIGNFPYSKMVKFTEDVTPFCKCPITENSGSKFLEASLIKSLTFSKFTELYKSLSNFLSFKIVILILNGFEGLFGA